MDHLTPEQLATLRAKLEAEREQLFNRLTHETDELVEPTTDEPGDIEDSAAVDAAHFRANSLRERERKHLAEIEEALTRMHEGTYGICEDTDDEIPYRRLLLEPTARLTVAAQEQREREGGVDDPYGNEPVGY